jgi:hypothetical protein
MKTKIRMETTGYGKCNLLEGRKKLEKTEKVLWQARHRG